MGKRPTLTAAVSRPFRCSGDVAIVLPSALAGVKKNRRRCILEVIRCGGDTDTTDSIVGGIIAAPVRTKYRICRRRTEHSIVSR